MCTSARVVCITSWVASQRDLWPPSVRRHGVNRTHVIHARVPGALLLELYSRDGLGTMVSADFYEGAESCTGMCGRTSRRDRPSRKREQA